MIKNSKKGFTLVELLAVMSVLAIIALIAVPVVTDTIRKAKDKASLVNAELYLKAAHEAILEYKLDDTEGFYPNTCTVDGKNLNCGSKVIKVKVKGNPPDRGTITYKNEEISEVELVYGKKTIVNNQKGILVFVDTLKEENTLDTLCTQDTTNGVAAKTAGAKYSCEVKEGTSYNFYVLTTPEEGAETINLIMDRNICEDGTPTESGKTCLVAYNSSRDAAGVGPVTAMTYLNNATSSWENIDNLDLTYDDEGGNFTGFALNGKARLPYKSEVADSNGSNEYLYENLDGISWMGSGTQPTNNISGIYGYWTLSSDAGNSSSAWCVFYRGYVADNFVGSVSYYGVRAVINLKI